VRPELTYEDFQKLAAIAQISDEDKKLQLYRWVQKIAKAYWQFDDYCALAPELVQLERLSKKVMVEWRAMTRAAANYKKLWNELGKVLLENYTKANRILERKGIPFDAQDGAAIPDCIEQLAELERAQSSRQRSDRRPGRPAGSEGDRMLRLLVVDLLTGVKDAGGHLSFNKEDESKGGLCQALRFLAPFLPPHAVPKRLPLRTMRRIVRSSARGQ
jgi:hypothetical protein